MIALLLAAAAAHERYDAALAPRAAELLAEAVRFATVAGNDSAQSAQKEWLLRTAAALGLATRDAGMVTEIEAMCSRWTRGPGRCLPSAAWCATGACGAAARRTTRGRWCRRCSPSRR